MKRALLLTNLMFSLGSAAYALDDAAPYRAAHWLHERNMGEIKGAELGLARASTWQVRGLADLLLRDHRSVEEMLNSVAEREGLQGALSEPTAPPAELAELQGLQGSRFDEAYLRFVLHSDRELLRDIDGLQANSLHSDLDDLISKWKGIFLQHEQLASVVQADIGLR